VTNRSSVALHDVRVAGAVQKNRTSNHFYKEYALSGSLKPGQSTTLAMGVKLADFNVGLKQVKGQVRSAEVVD